MKDADSFNPYLRLFIVCYFRIRNLRFDRPFQQRYMERAVLSETTTHHIYIMVISSLKKRKTEEKKSHKHYYTWSLEQEIEILAVRWTQYSVCFKADIQERLSRCVVLVKEKFFFPKKIYLFCSCFCMSNRGYLFVCPRPRPLRLRWHGYWSSTTSTATTPATTAWSAPRWHP